VSWLQLLRSAWSEYERDYARYFAVAIVYYALISFLPLLLLLLAVTGFLLRSSEIAASLEQQLLGMIEGNFGPQLRVTIEQSLESLQQQSVVAGVVSAIALLMTASVLFRNLRMTFRAIWKHNPLLIASHIGSIVRATLLERTLSFAVVLAAAMLLVVVVGLVVIVQWLLPFLNREITWIVSLIVALVTVPLIFALLFKILPPVHVQLRHIWLASLMCTAAWLLGLEALAIYGAYFGKNLGTYEAFGGILILMLWMKIMSQVLFFGAELCKVNYHSTAT